MRGQPDFINNKAWGWWVGSTINTKRQIKNAIKIWNKTIKMWYNKNKKGQDTDTAEERGEDDLARPVPKQGTENDSPPQQPREHRQPGAQPNEQQAREKQQGQATEKGQTPRPNRPTRPTQTRNEARTGRTAGGNTPPTLSLFSLLFSLLLADRCAGKQINPILVSVAP